MLTALLSLGLIACSGGKTQESKETQFSSQQTTEYTESVSAYLTLKDALVKTDPVAAKGAAEKLTSALESDKMQSKMIKAAKGIASSEDIATQRADFKIITDGLINLLKSNGAKAGVYVQYCPMAFNNTGANWLSLSKEIRNPYFGDMMLKCGKVTEEL